MTLPGRLRGPRRVAAVLAAAALVAGGCSSGVSGTLPLPPSSPTPSPTAPPADPWAEYGVLAERPRGDLDERQRALVAFGDVRAEVTAGGFAQYFSGAAGDYVTDALAAADTADVPALAAIVRRALRQLGADEPPYPVRTERQAMVTTLEATGTPFDAVDEELYALEESTDLDAAMRRLATAGR